MLKFEQAEVFAVGDDKSLARPGHGNDIEALAGERMLFVGGLDSLTEAELAFESAEGVC